MLLLFELLLLELLQNLKNLDKKDVFIKNKIKMFRIRYLNLTLGSSNEKGFELLINDIILRRKNIIKDLNKYSSKFYFSFLFSKFN